MDKGFTEIWRTHDKSNNVFVYSISSHGCNVDMNNVAIKLKQLTGPDEEIMLLAKFISTLELCRAVEVEDSTTPYYGENRDCNGEISKFA